MVGNMKVIDDMSLIKGLAMSILPKIIACFIKSLGNKILTSEYVGIGKMMKLDYNY